ANRKYQQHLQTTQASAILVESKIDDLDIPHIIVKNAYIAFVFLLRLFNPPDDGYIKGQSEHAYIDASAKVAPSACIGPFVYIGPDCSVGEKTTLYPGVVLLKNVTIGRECVLYPNVSIREDCSVGNRVILHNGCVVGSDGFGFAPKGDGYVKIPQLGSVVIEDDVEIGANSTIDRATLGETIIRQGTKLDNLVQIAHNVEVGTNTVIASQTGVAGSTKIGNHVTIAGQVGIVGHITIGDRAILAAQSGISKSVPEKSIMFGTPALPLSKQKRIDVSLRHLPEMVKKIHQLENEIIALKEELQKRK
ncbi:MAG TPA: UDP-3-O-(3-hydroxymyristoyl)glucosamine N-acyltransferase, partial [Calditrichaeota bacterium]|nr:UDP-3-O-(3-hydroxymyristoyl)glucosamine N-acyltransferase [Calditrichota bacterium]